MLTVLDGVVTAKGFFPFFLCDKLAALQPFAKKERHQAGTVLQYLPEPAEKSHSIHLLFLLRCYFSEKKKIVLLPAKALRKSKLAN